MKGGGLLSCLLFAGFVVACRERAPQVQQSKAPSSNLQYSATDTGTLFLTDDDIAHLKQTLPGLAEASHHGRRETAAYLATLDMPFDRIMQILSNISVAYSAIKFEQWMRDIKPVLDTGKSSVYGQRVEEGQRQLTQITMTYRDAKRGRRTALDVNQEIVGKHLADVEALLIQMQGMNSSSMPFHQ